jgi:hypothetical protein
MVGRVILQMCHTSANQVLRFTSCPSLNNFAEPQQGQVVGAARTTLAFNILGAKLAHWPSAREQSNRRSFLALDRAVIP